MFPRAGNGGGEDTAVLIHVHRTNYLLWIWTSNASRDHDNMTLTQRHAELGNRQGASPDPQGDARVIREWNKMLPTLTSDWHTRMDEA